MTEIAPNKLPSEGKRLPNAPEAPLAVDPAARMEQVARCIMQNEVYGAMHGIAGRFLDNVAAGEDVVGNMLAKIMQKSAADPGVADSFLHWGYLLGSLRNEITTYVRTTQALKHGGGRVVSFDAFFHEFGGEHFNFIDQDSDPEKIVLTNMIAEQVLGRLTPEHRDALTRVDMYDMFPPDAAEALNIPHGTIKSRLYHGRRAGQAALRQMGLMA